MTNVYICLLVSVITQARHSGMIRDWQTNKRVILTSVMKMVCHVFILVNHCEGGKGVRVWS